MCASSLDAPLINVPTRKASVRRRMRLQRIAWLVALVAVALALVLLFQSRATTLRHHAVPYDLEVTANVVGFAGKVRYFPRDPGDIKLITKEFVDSWEVEKAHLHRQDLPPASYLAISGGRSPSAFYPALRHRVQQCALLAVL